jgi:hypothetical protein
MSEEIEILLAAKSFHEMLGDLFDDLDAEWLSQMDGRMRPGGKMDLASLGQAVFFEQFRCVLSSMYLIAAPVSRVRLVDSHTQKSKSWSYTLTYLKSLCVRKVGSRKTLSQLCVCFSVAWHPLPDSATSRCSAAGTPRASPASLDSLLSISTTAGHIYSVSIELVSLRTLSKSLPNA